MGIGEFPQQAENRFRVTKALLAEEFDSLTKRLIDAKIKEKIAGGLLNELGGKQLELHGKNPFIRRRNLLGS